MYTIQKGARGTCHIGLHFLAMPSKIKIQYSIDDTHWALRLYLYTHIHIIEGSLEVKLPTIWTDEKQSRARGREKRKIRRDKIRRERVRGQKIQMREKVGKSRNTVFFQ
jgi:hypothetical protein